MKAKHFLLKVICGGSSHFVIAVDCNRCSEPPPFMLKTAVRCKLLVVDRSDRAWSVEEVHAITQLLHSMLNTSFEWDIISQEGEHDYDGYLIVDL